jgi:hypothetical protein
MLAKNIALALVLTPGLVRGQEQRIESKSMAADLLSRKVSWRQPDSTEANIVLVSDLEMAQIPGGIFRERSCKDTEPTLIPAVEAKFEDELHRIADLKPDYQWTLDDGVLNFFPRLLSPSPLDVPIKEFTVENEPAEQVYRKLFETADVKNGLMRLGLHEPTVQIIIGLSTPPNIDGASPPNKELKRITLNLKNTRLREASNAIVRADGRKTWVLSVVSCKGDSTYSYQLVN